MNWESFYLVCFGAGLALCILSFAGGLGHFHAGHFHLGHHTHPGRAHTNSASPFNFFSAMAFLCWFGGAGYLLTHYRVWGVSVVLGLSALIGLAGAAVIFGFLAKVLLPHERLLMPEDTEMRGVVGRVTSPLRTGGLGEILFSLNGTRRSAAARTESGQPIDREAQVVVLRYENGIAWVRPFDELDDFDGSTQPDSPNAKPT